MTPLSHRRNRQRIDLLQLQYGEANKGIKAREQARKGNLYRPQTEELELVVGK